MIFFKFISGIYLKNFFIIFLSLVIFYCGVDLLLNFKNLPSSANLTLLYVIFLAFSAVTYILPFALVFALILSLVNMIRNNEFVSFCALGISKNKIIIFPLFWALFFCFLFIGANFTSFTYANDYKSNILRSGSVTKASDEIFLKYNNDFIYIEKQNQNLAQNIRVFSFENDTLTNFLAAKKGVFKDETWILEDVNKSTISSDLELKNEALKHESFTSLKSDFGFNPKIIENATSKGSIAISDIIKGLFLLKEQGINTHELRVNLYKLIFTPFLAPLLMIIMFYFFPLISRFYSLPFVSFIALITTFAINGALFLLIRLAQNGVLNAELAVILPILCLAFLASFLFYKHI